LLIAKVTQATLKCALTNMAAILQSSVIKNIQNKINGQPFDTLYCKDTNIYTSQETTRQEAQKQSILSDVFYHKRRQEINDISIGSRINI